MTVRARTLRSALAVLLLLLQALLPCVHRLQHAVADASAHREAPCACGHDHAGSPAAPSRAPAAGADHEHAAHDCAICQLLLLVRDLLPAGEDAAAAPAPRGCDRNVPAACTPAAAAAALRPPVRGPPVS